MIARVHMGCVAIGGRGVLVAGPPGRGKSDLALRLIDRGARLVSDDYTELRLDGDRLVARAPETIRGRLEVRGVGLVESEPADDVPVCLVVDLDSEPERLPEPRRMVVAGGEVPVVGIAALEASAPLKVELALQRFGLALP